MYKGIAFSWFPIAVIIICSFTLRVTALPYTSKAIWNQLQEEYPEVTQELLEQIRNEYGMRTFDNKRNFDRDRPEDTDLGWNRSASNARPLMLKWIGHGGGKRSSLDFSNFERRRRSF